MWVGAVLIISLVLSGFCIILRVFCVKNRKWSILQWILCVWISHLPSHYIYYQRTIKVIRKSFVGIIPSEKIEDWSRLLAAYRQEKENHVVH